MKFDAEMGFYTVCVAKANLDDGRDEVVGCVTSPPNRERLRERVCVYAWALSKAVVELALRVPPPLDNHTDRVYCLIRL